MGESVDFASPKIAFSHSANSGLWNFYESPSHLQGSFDVIHVRVIVGAIRSGDPGPVLDRLIQLLKPDGILQWDEGAIAEPRLKYPPGHSSDAFVDVLNTIASKTGAKTGIGNWVAKLGSIFQEHGLQLVEEKRGGEVKTKMWKYWPQTQIVYPETKSRSILLTVSCKQGAVTKTVETLKLDFE